MEVNLTLRECGVCHEWKPLSDFYRNNSRGWRGYFRTCKKCFGIRDRAGKRARGWKDPRQSSGTHWERAKRLPARECYMRWRQEGCAVCGESDERVVQAHHIDPSEKERSPSSITSLGSMESELKKCIQLCANHHILVHMELRNGHKGSTTEEVVAYLREGTNARLRVAASS